MLQIETAICWLTSNLASSSLFPFAKNLITHPFCCFGYSCSRNTLNWGNSYRITRTRIAVEIDLKLNVNAAHQDALVIYYRGRSGKVDTGHCQCPAIITDYIGKQILTFVCPVANIYLFWCSIYFAFRTTESHKNPQLTVT